MVKIMKEKLMEASGRVWEFIFLVVGINHLILYRDIYFGQWNDSFEGEGTYIYQNGERYKGQFNKGKKEGQGKYYYLIGAEYNGTWVNDQREGFGKFRYQNGDVYEGNWLRGFKSG